MSATSTDDGKSSLDLIFDDSEDSFSFSAVGPNQSTMVLRLVDVCSGDFTENSGDTSSSKDDAEDSDDGAQTSTFRIYRGVVESCVAGSAQWVPEANADVAVKLIARMSGLRKLRREAAAYRNLLGDLQGTVVPKFYGEYVATIEGVELGCIVMEWCEAPPTVFRDETEITRKTILAICRLHSFGFTHGALGRLGHTLFAPDRSVRIVSFSKLKLHECKGGMPLLYKETPGEVPRGCEELFQTEVRLGWRCGCLSPERLQEELGYGRKIHSPEETHEVALAVQMSTLNVE